MYGDEPIEGVKASTYLLVGLLGYGVAATAFMSLAITLVVRREAGLLKRVRGLLSPATYLSAVIASMVLVIGLGRHPAADRPLPARCGRRLRLASFAVMILFGAAAFAALGVAIGVRPLRGRLVRHRQCHLPADGVHLRRVLLDRGHAGCPPGHCGSSLTHLLRLIRATFIEGEWLPGLAGPLLAVALGPGGPSNRDPEVPLGAPGGYGDCMKAPTLVFARETEGQPELVVNFGVFSGREVTDAEVYRLAQVRCSRRSTPSRSSASGATSSWRLRGDGLRRPCRAAA